VQLFCLSYIGLAAAIGHPVDVPVLTRALACDYYRRGNNLSILGDSNFVRSLDAGTAEDDPAAMVDRYAYQWWTEPLTENMEILAESNIEECLESFNLLAKTPPTVPGRFKKQQYTWCRDLSLNPWGVDIDCRRCRLYRAVSMNAADEILDLRHQLQGWEEFAKTQSDATARECIGFFELEQAAVKKEMNSGGPNSGGPNPCGPNTGGPNTGGPGSLSEQVRVNAAAEVVRLQSLPNVKWTSGPEVTEDDALNYFKRAADGPKSEHSGYADSLPSGFVDEWSSAASLAVGSGRFSPEPRDVRPLRDLLPHEYPGHFEDSPLRHCFGEAPTLVDGHLEDPPAAHSDIQPASALHPPPANYIQPPPVNNVNCKLACYR
jgi:hypothetical protein